MVTIWIFGAMPKRDARTAPDPGETLCFARPGFPAAAGEDDSSTLLAFGRADPSA